MKSQDFLKANQVLLGGTAILALGAVLSGHAAGLMAGKVALDAIALSGFVGNVLAGMTANHIGELVKKLRENPDWYTSYFTQTSRKVTPARNQENLVTVNTDISLPKYEEK